jgi:hypothetical protein
MRSRAWRLAAVCWAVTSSPLLAVPGCRALLQPFFDAMHRALKPGGIVCTQAESLWCVGL